MERVALLDRAWFQREIARHHLEWVAAWGDYQGRLSPDDPEASRLIILARAP
jgi:hypothetical protein